MSANIDYSYHYAFQSQITSEQSKSHLSLATSDIDFEQPHFFSGDLIRPKMTAGMLLLLNEIVATHFFKPMPPLLDPVVTANEQVLRFEGFSGCCGVYARFDLTQEGFAGDHQRNGTTNIDFNMAMQRQLRRLTDQTASRINVGVDELQLEAMGEAITEKKVKMPVRWVKGFSEVQAYQPSLKLAFECSGQSARQFFRALPKGNQHKNMLYVEKVGQALRVSPRARVNSVAFSGVHRIKILEQIMPYADKLKVYNNSENGVSLWQVDSAVGRFNLMLSPELYRGFSGEGQLLSALSADKNNAHFALVKAQLNWQNTLDIAELSAQTKLNTEQINTQLLRLGSQGLAGFDLENQRYFHRQLPFQIDQVESQQPRLKAARKLVAENKVEQIDEQHFKVAGTGIKHIVNREKESCTCPWYGKYQGKRGPCKHILAAQIYAN